MPVSYLNVECCQVLHHGDFEEPEPLRSQSLSTWRFHIRSGGGGSVEQQLQQPGLHVLRLYNTSPCPGFTFLFVWSLESWVVTVLQLCQSLKLLHEDVCHARNESKCQTDGRRHNKQTNSHSVEFPFNSHSTPRLPPVTTPGIPTLTLSTFVLCYLAVTSFNIYWRCFRCCFGSAPRYIWLLLCISNLLNLLWRTTKLMNDIISSVVHCVCVVALQLLHCSV